MSRKRTKPVASIYQIKVTLQGCKPPIWRRIQVIGDTTLYRLHEIIQVVMGWDDYHLHQFTIEGAYYGKPEKPIMGFGVEVKNEGTARLRRVVKGEKFKFLYEYDFGDSWTHTLRVEKIIPPEPGVKYPICLGGKRACPPEDCGGVWGYAEKLEMMDQPNHPEYEELMEWLGSDFDPEAFSVDAVNAALKDMNKLYIVP